ncbi:MAG: transglutaminase family protein [Azoarcus sp.]|jgi:transglutaminase-like putative cysteine protease|nr:transglutaminase family protein [Azoarcus sp.]
MTPDALRYLIRHDTRYRYDQAVGESRQIVRLRPRELPRQHCIAHRLETDPAPRRSESYNDGFGNPVCSLHFEREHDVLFVRAESLVEIMPPPRALDESPPWETVRNKLAYCAGHPLDAAFLEAAGCLFESRYVRVKHDFAEYAHADFPPATPLLVGADRLMRRIHREFTYDPEATDISTPVTEVLASRRGVCQDFAHLMLSCLRSLGLAARYVSGYILTHPPAGKERLVGADATHAWVSVFCPGQGWVDFDPTNAQMPATEHVTLGWGRDFADISPLRGVILGSGGHKMEIAVTMVRETESHILYPETPVVTAFQAIPTVTFHSMGY